MLNGVDSSFKNQNAFNRALRYFFALLFVFLSATSSEARTFREAYEHLKTSFPHGATLGMVCEELAKWQFTEKYSESEYEIETGIVYRSDGGQRLGELDLVVFEKKSGQVKLVGETKCSNDVRALHLAQKQLIRLKKYLDWRTHLDFSSTVRRGIRFSTEQFYGAIQYAFIFPKSAKFKSKIVSLEFSLKEVHALHALLSDEASSLPRETLRD